jgi:8-oxo-dGTP pyrophosphatase MutT (NUDIX family)
MERFSVTTEATPAATVLLLRDEPAFEVLMVERHENIRFAGGALVFPGGRIDGGDQDPDWIDYCDGYKAAPVDERTPLIAAIREAFEETGILLARHKAGGDFIDDNVARALTPWRKHVEDDGRKFLELVRQENLTLACDALCLFARWIAPKNARHHRFDTWFFAAKTPPGQQAREDGNEATEAIWLAPGDALKARESGERKMIFPTTRNVELLNVSDSVETVIAFAAERKIERVQPEIIARNGQHYVSIPKDLGYPVTEEALETAMRV